MIETMDLCNTGGGRVNWDPLMCCILSIVFMLKPRQICHTTF